MAEINLADTGFLAVCTALVLFMTPGLALFYAGMVRRKNALSTTMHSFFAMGLVSVFWAVAGYSIAFGPNDGPLAKVIGGFSRFGLAAVLDTAVGAPGHQVPEAIFVLFQGMFAIITVALITGAIAERMKFSAYVIFAAVWSLVVYAPLAHWVWGGGWLGHFEGSLGALDFAGGTVVHIASASAALAAALVLGKRKALGSAELQPHNLPMTILGAGILWFGWFGFNAGSALAVDGVMASAFLATHLSAAAGMLGWLAVEWLEHRKATSLGAASGAVAGLVGITPAAGFVGPGAALLIGFAVGALCYYGVRIKNKFGFDDALDVVGIHGLGGTVGAVLTGVFASTAINAAGRDGLLYGNPAQLLPQILGVLVTIAFSFTLSWIILKVLDATMGIRVDASAEERGLDLSDHAEAAYDF